MLRELIGDMRLAGHQHFAFHEYKDPHGNRLFAGDAKGSVSLQDTDLDEDGEVIYGNNDQARNAISCIFYSISYTTWCTISYTLLCIFWPGSQASWPARKAGQLAGH